MLINLLQRSAVLEPLRVISLRYSLFRDEFVAIKTILYIIISDDIVGACCNLAVVTDTFDIL